MSILKEFKEFAMRGNVIDLAVGVVVGADFGRIVSSLVDDLVMPPLSLVTGNINFSDKVLVLKQATEGAKAITLNYGNFITVIINFLIVAFAIFLLVKQINRLQRKGSEAPPDPTAKNCPFCYSSIPLKAIRCPQCTSDLDSK